VAQVVKQTHPLFDCLGQSQVPNVEENNEKGRIHKSPKGRMHKKPKFFGKSVQTDVPVHFVDNKNTFKKGDLAPETTCCVRNVFVKQRVMKTFDSKLSLFHFVFSILCSLHTGFANQSSPFKHSLSSSAVLCGTEFVT